MSGVISAKFFYNGYWVKFSLVLGIYDNFLSFLSSHEISFLAEMKIDFTNIPVSLHGNGISNNLYEYVSNNTNNHSLINSFFDYFLKEIAIFKYSTNHFFNFSFSTSSAWQTSTFFANGYEPITTTTTTTIIETTTMMPMSMSMFDIFGQLHNI
jgi:hypothetical protein